MKREEILSLAWETAGNPEFWDDDDIVEFAETVALRAALAEPEDGLYLTIVYRDVQPGPECTDICRHPKVSAVSWSHAIDDRNAARAALVEPAVAHEREADTALLRQSLAYVRWAAFGECRTPGWDGPPPTASGLEEALLERLGESHEPR